METARFLVGHGAHVSRSNSEGISVHHLGSIYQKIDRTNVSTEKPVDHIREEFPEIAAYLESVEASPDAPPTTTTSDDDRPPPSQHAQNIATEALTSSLMASAQEIMARAEREGTDPDRELRAAVSHTVMQGVVDGYQLGSEAGGDRRESPEPDAKRRRPEEQ
jgi:uncharacterized protein